MLRDRFRTWAAVGVLSLGAAASVLAQTPSAAPTPQTWDPLFDDTVVHEIRLAINSKDWQSLQVYYLDDTYYPCDFRWRDQVVRNIGIRSRGTGSRSGVKPGLRVDFSRYVTDQAFLGLSSLVLRNNTQDPTNLHERVSMLLFKRMGLPASREAHTRLYVNNQYAGLYSIVESIDKRFLQETFNENDGYLYKYEYPSTAQPYYFEDRGSNPEAYVPLPFKPETHTTDPRPEFIAQLIQTANQASDAVFRTVIAEFIDLAKFLRHVAVENFVADNDGFLGDYGINNFYFYQFQNKKLFTFIAWDKSEAFKNGFDYSIFHNINGVPDAQKNRLMARVLAYPDLYNLYLDTLLECVQSAAEPEPGVTGGPGWLEREIAREYQQIRDSALTDPQKLFTNDEFEKGIADLGLFAQHRGESVSRQVGAARVSR